MHGRMKIIMITTIDIDFVLTQISLPKLMGEPTKAHPFLASTSISFPKIKARLKFVSLFLL